MFSRLKVSLYVNHTYKVVQTPITFKSYKTRLKNYWGNDNEKLCNNVARARTKLFDYAMSNKFEYFVTITVNPEHDRQDLEWLRKVTNQIIRDLRRKYHTEFKYILIPEQHKDGSWHMHGLFDSSFGVDFYINDYGYMSWASYDKIGFSSISKIHDYVACIKYITKYVKKDFEKREKGKHLYFCSNNLNTSIELLDCVLTGNDIEFDFYSKYAYKQVLTEEQFNNFMYDIKDRIYTIE